MSEAAETAPVAPMFHVTAGNPTPEEIAAVTVVLAAAFAAAGGTDSAQRSRRGWTNRARTMPGWASTSGWGSR